MPMVNIGNGIFELDMADKAIAKSICQCDNCKTSIDTSKPKATKKGEKPKANPSIQATLATGLDSDETKAYHFCDEECLRQYLNKRVKTK